LKPLISKSRLLLPAFILSQTALLLFGFRCVTLLYCNNSIQQFRICCYTYFMVLVSLLRLAVKNKKFLRIYWQASQ